MTRFTLISCLTLAVSFSAFALHSKYGFDPLHHLSVIAPYFESRDPPLSPDPPQGCTAERAAYLVRHGAIYTNDYDYNDYIKPFIDKLGNTTDVDWTKVPELSFLASWQTPMSTTDILALTRTGRLEATQLGVDLNFRYPNLGVPRQIWTSSSPRTRQSAMSLARGLEQYDNNIQVRSIDESRESGANSLTPYKACPAYSSSGSKESDEVKKRYIKPILARLQLAAPNFNFRQEDVFSMQQLCAYETAIRGKSPFCSLDLFSPDDWLAWEYAADIRFHYGMGYGNNLAGYNGFPWLDATGSLLMNNNKDDGVDDLLVSFTQREMVSMVIVAMGLFNNSEFSGAATSINDTMPVDRINYRRVWKTSNIVPSLGNIAIERLKCKGSYGYDDGDYYRTLVNSAPQPWPSCSDGPGTSCSRQSFADYLEHRTDLFAGFTKHCKAMYKGSTDQMTLYRGKRPTTNDAIRSSR